MAKPNWLEELAENWFRMRGYITQLHVRIPKFGRYELDLLAFNSNEFWIVDLQTYLGEKGAYRKEASGLAHKFKFYIDGFRTTPPYSNLFKSRKLKCLFVAGGNLQFKNLIAKHGIDFMEMEEFLGEILKEVQKYAIKQRWPFPSDDISRLLYELVLYGFVSS